MLYPGSGPLSLCALFFLELLSVILPHPQRLLFMVFDKPLSSLLLNDPADERGRALSSVESGVRWLFLRQAVRSR
jgi:hypothetical protein